MFTLRRPQQFISQIRHIDTNFIQFLSFFISRSTLAWRWLFFLLYFVFGGKQFLKIGHILSFYRKKRS